MRNPKLPPSTKRPPPPKPQEVNFIQKLDTSEPALYVVQYEHLLSIAKRERIKKYLLKEITPFAPGSGVIILDGVTSTKVQTIPEKICYWEPEMHPQPEEAEAFFDTECGLLRAEYNGLYMKHCPKCGGKIMMKEPSDAWMNERIGEKETVGFPSWYAMRNAPKDRYILIKDSHDEYAVVKWDNEHKKWLCSGDCYYKPVKWMEVPK